MSIIMKAWKDGQLQPCTVAEFTRGLRQMAGWADEEFGTRSDPAGLSERLYAAADLIDKLGTDITRGEKWIIDREITIKLAPRDDGGLRVWSDDLPGLILSHQNQAMVLADIGAAITILLQSRQRPTHRPAIVSKVDE